MAGNNEDQQIDYQNNEVIVSSTLREKTDIGKQIVSQCTTQQLLVELLNKDKEREEKLRQLEIENEEYKKQNHLLKEQNDVCRKENNDIKKDNERLRIELARFGASLSDNDQNSHKQDKDIRMLEERNVEAHNRCKLFVTGISKNISELEIQMTFEKYGSVIDVYNSGQGNAFVTFQRKIDADKAIADLNNKTLFGEQIKVEEAKIGLLDLPPEMIQQINHKLPLQAEKQFREVCLGCPVLRQAYRDEIENSGIMKVNLCKIPRNLNSVKFINDFNIFVNSNLKLSLTLPSQYELLQVENLRSKLIQILDVCGEMISEIVVNSDVPRDLLEVVVPRLKGLKKIKVVTDEDRDSLTFQQLINNSCDSVEFLDLSGMTFSNAQINVMPKLTEIQLNGRRGTAGIQTLLSKAENLKKVKFENMDVDHGIAATVGDMKNLEELQLKWCRGAVSALLTAAAASISTLALAHLDMNTLVEKPFTKLKVLVIREFKYNKWFCKEVDISGSPLLQRGGSLREFGSKVKRSWEEDLSGNVIGSQK